MGLFSQINLKFFLLAFAVGLLVCYLMAPPPEVVVKFPSPFNAGKIVYQDKAGTCFMYKADKSACPKDKASIKEQPIVMDD
jgi:hypothetical protein